MPGIGELLILLTGLALVVFWIWMLIDCATKMDNADPKKKSWIIWIVLLGALGAALYFFGPRSRRKKG